MTLARRYLHRLFAWTKQALAPVERDLSKTDSTLPLYRKQRFAVNRAAERQLAFWFSLRGARYAWGRLRSLWTGAARP
jgi:hypothetical protein